MVVVEDRLSRDSFFGECEGHVDDILAHLLGFDDIEVPRGGRNCFWILGGSCHTCVRAGEARGLV